MMWYNNEYLYLKIVEFQNTYPDFPFINLNEFCKQAGWNLISYDDTNIKLNKISIDGFCFYEDNEYSIFYNKSMPLTRSRFTVAHEIAHIYLEHHKYVPPKILTYGSRNKGIWEKQANIFAHNVLVPCYFANTLKNHSVEEVSKSFNLSEKMLKYRFSKLKEDNFYLEKTKKYFFTHF